MQIRQEIVEKHWLNAAIEEAASTYAAQGYDISRDTVIGTVPVDLVARKGEELVVVEFKLGNWSPKRTEAVRHLRNDVVHRLGGKFKLAVVRPPEEKHIDIKGIDRILYNIFTKDLSIFEQSTTHIDLSDVSDVMITSVDVASERMRLEGIGVASVELHEAASTEITIESFPFEFVIILDNQLNLVQVEQLHVETAA